jgi:tellurite resistance protein
MAIKYGGLRSQGELGNPFDRDEEAITALVTAGALVALSDGRVDSIERDAVIDYIDRRRLAPAISRDRIAKFFDARVRALQGRDFAELVVAAFRPVVRLRFAAEVMRLAERTAAADGRLSSSEVQMITLMRLIISPSGAADQESKK